MRCAVWVFRLSVLCAAWAGVFQGHAAESKIELATDSPRPLPPAESAKRFRLPNGFHMELAASEPLLAEPVAMDIDAKGRIFVCEIHGYNLEGYLDALEQNKTGVLDKQVRRILANPDAIKQAAANQYGTVKLLEDTDGDGRMDRVTVWADRLPPCYGVVAARDGVIVLCAPDIIYLGDRDGDGKPEIRETLFTGFGLYELWSRINNPRWGLDNWIYAANGIECGGTITGPRLSAPVKLDSVCFRFKPDGSAIEPVSGAAGGYGLTMNDWGDRFLVTNQQHVLLTAPIEHRYLKRNPYYAAPNPTVNICTYGHPAAVYPISQPDPWRSARAKDPRWMQFYGAAEATANGFFTAASGQAIYRGERFPPEYYGNHFSVDNAQNLVHRCVLSPDGVLWSARRPDPNEKIEFLTSTEQWFRPVQLMTGPEGGLYVVDMYRAIIEDYSAIPRYLQQLYIKDLIAGSTTGRIWRIMPDRTPPPKRIDLNQAAGRELVGALDHPNAWRRATAQRLLVERGDRSLAPLLAASARNAKTPQGRLHSLYALDGLRRVDRDTVLYALADAHFAVRMHAATLAEPWLDRDPAVLQKALAVAEDPHPRVRLQAALSLGESRSPEAVRALRTLALRHADDPWMRAAIASATAESSHILLRELAAAGKLPDSARQLAASLASVVGARRRDEEIAAALEGLAGVAGTDGPALQTAALKGLIEGLRRGRTSRLSSPAGQAAVRRLLGSPSPDVAAQALSVAGLLDLRDAPEMQVAYAVAGRVALEAGKPVEDRLVALRLLSVARFAQMLDVVRQLLDPRQPLELQLEAVAAAQGSDDPKVAALLLEQWQVAGPKVQAAMMDALFARQNRLPPLLDAVATGKVPRNALDSFRRVQLRENPDIKIRSRAATLFAAGGGQADRGEVLARYVRGLSNRRDAKRGKEVHDKQCSKCHKVKDHGYVVGPDMSVITRKSDEMLVSDILDPSNQITVGYNVYTVITEDGKTYTGLLAAETATSVTLRKEQAVEETILRKDIEAMAATSLSMMPEGLEKEVSVQDVADLIAYLREAFGAAAAPGIVLFDDEPSFVAALDQGAGKATLDSVNPFSGKVSLRIDPPQRWSDKLPGWTYRIRENPGPNEFRYLRWAWRSQGAAGTMVELAADGQWPPGDKPLRRYCAGKNSSGWAAMEIAPAAPGPWTVVTRDLWKDFGDFTLTGIAPTAMGGPAWFDRIQLLRTLDDAAPAR